MVENNQQENGKKRKWLIAFDMDHTILELNSDFEIRNLLPNEITENIMQTVKNDKLDWMSTMQLFFDTFKDNKITVEKLEETIKSIPLTAGMKELFDYIRCLKKEHKEITFHVIILSGANMKFVKWIIEAYNIGDIINNYYSFSCDIKDDKLVIGPFHEHECNSCHPFLCKKLAIEDLHLKDNNEYEKLIYLGDGWNDYCACLALNKVEDSIVYYREDFGLDNILFKSKDSEDKRKQIKSKLVKWKDGIDILNHLKTVIV